MTKHIKGSYIFYSFLVLGFLNGFLLSIQFIKSQAYFLSHFSAKDMVYAVFAPLLVWYGLSFFLRTTLNQAKFVRFYQPTLLLLGLTLTLTSFFIPQSPYFIVVWIFMAGFYSEFFRWGIMEMQERYINPSKIGFIYSYQGIWNELGILAGILFITLLPHLTLTQLSSLTWSIVLLKLLIIYFIFMNPRTLEIHYQKEEETSVFSHLFQDKMYRTYIFLGLFFGLYKVAQDTLANSFFQSVTQERLDIQSFISKAMLIGSCFQILTSFLSGRIVEKYRLSPITTLYVSWTLYFAFSLTCIFNNSLWGYILFLSCSKGFAGIYFPTTSRISGSYENTKKISLRTLHFWGTVALTSIIFYFIPAQKPFLIFLLCCSFLSVLYVIFILGQQHSEALEKLISSNKLSNSIRAVVGLSYLQPQGYFSKMETILNQNPHQILKKQIILGLGHHSNNESVSRLIQEFNSDKEEIQITVIDALKMANSNKATKFALDLVLSNKKSLTPRVRLNASQIVVALYGEKSIPILMLGLQEDDSRMIANVIEALSQFKTRELIEVYKKYAPSKIPRIKANALIALLKYSDQKEDVLKEISFVLDSIKLDQLGEKISIFYVIGKNKVTLFKNKLLQMYETHTQEFENYKNLDPLALSYTQTLSWALLRLGEPKGYYSLLKLFNDISDIKKIKSVLHFYVQLEDIEKFDCLDFWMLNSANKILTQKRLIELFQNSGLDFTEEINYLNSLKPV